jgi:hypothetical protein
MRRSVLPLVLLFAGSCPALEPVSAEGQKLALFLDSMHVEEHWKAGVIVNWLTGDPTGKPVTDDGKHTHCSAFAAAVCDHLGIYLLHPPEHKSTLLANAQFDWLPSQGLAKGWTPVRDGVEAQDLANRGQIVVAVCKNSDPKKSGHAAVIRPGTRTAEEIAQDGPDIIQAGGHNYNSARLKQGFANHPGAFANGEVRYYAHPASFR